MKPHTFDYDSVHGNIYPSPARRGDLMRAIIERQLCSFAPVMCVLIFGGLAARAQGIAGQSRAENQQDLGAKIELLTHSIEQMQSELEQSRVEIQQLRDMITQILRTQANSSRTNAVEEHAGAGQEAQSPAATAPPAHIAEDDWQ